MKTPKSLLGRGIAYFLAEKDDTEVSKNVNSSKSKVIINIVTVNCLVAILGN